MLGGGGHDHFSFATGSGVDRVKDFVLGSDQIMIEGVDASKVILSVHGTRVWVEWGTTDRIILCGLDLSAAITVDNPGIGYGFDHFA